MWALAFAPFQLGLTTWVALLTNSPRKHHWRDLPQAVDTLTTLDYFKSECQKALSVDRFPLTDIWESEIPCSDASVRAHVAQLAIPVPRSRRDDRPLMTLYDLGGFQRDPVLRDRLRAVFPPHGHTCVFNG